MLALPHYPIGSTLQDILRALEKEQHSRAGNAVLGMFACLKYNKGCDSKNCAVCHKHQKLFSCSQMSKAEGAHCTLERKDHSCSCQKEDFSDPAETLERPYLCKHAFSEHNNLIAGSNHHTHCHQ